MVYKTSAFGFDNVDNLLFNPKTYSKMKFGSRLASLECAQDTADAFIQFLKDNNITKPIVVAPSAYQEIPKSSFHIFKPFVNIVNRWLFENDRPILTTTRIRSNHVYNVDYAKLIQKDREELIGKDKWKFNCDVLDDVHFIIMDDLRMTGNLEKVVLQQIENSCISKSTDVHLLYFAENTAVGKIPDNFESDLNHAAIGNYVDFINLIVAEGKVDWNIRNIKYVLELKDWEMYNFIEAVGTKIPNFLTFFYDLVIQSNCISAPKYQPNINYLKQLINAN